MAFFASISFQQAVTKQSAQQEAKTNPAQNLGKAVQDTFNTVHRGNLGNSMSEISTLNQTVHLLRRENKSSSKGLEEQINLVRTTYEQANERLSKTVLTYDMKIPRELEYKAQCSSLNKLSTFVQNNISLIHETKKLRITKNCEYLETMNSIKLNAGAAIADTVDQLTYLNLEENKSENSNLSSASQDIEDDFVIMDSGSKEGKIDTKLRGLISEHYLDTPTRTRFEIAGTVRDFFHTAAVFNAIDDSMLD